jgi:hypothetical protein
MAASLRLSIRRFRAGCQIFGHSLVLFSSADQETSVMRILDLVGDCPWFRRRLKIIGSGHEFAPWQMNTRWQSDRGNRKAALRSGSGAGQIWHMFHAGSWQTLVSNSRGRRGREAEGGGLLMH